MVIGLLGHLAERPSGKPDTRITAVRGGLRGDYLKNRLPIRGKSSPIPPFD